MFKFFKLVIQNIIILKNHCDDTNKHEYSNYRYIEAKIKKV